ncbi:MAG: DUF4058 family protein [Isosphaeraceae bacterium]|nr:DUF4058 family protein [Isosphaeraceae bacterium]
MPSPFPGMDPYLEAQGRWPGFHNALITHCNEALNRDLPEGYVAQIDERIALVSFDEPISQRVPDVFIGREEGASHRPSSTPPLPGALGLIEPITIPLAKRTVEVRETWIEIYQLPEMELVTVVEILSPSNKSGSGRHDYLAKRDALIDQPVNLVEVDLLLSGTRAPMERPLPPGDYYVIVARAGKRPYGDVYSWTVHDPLPRLPVPLRPPDSDVWLDLAEAFAMTYDRGGYTRVMRYGMPLPASLPIAPNDRVWAEGLTPLSGSDRG